MGVSLSLDSMATIGALSQGPVSERRRIRAAGRSWLNWCRKDLVDKSPYFTIQHIRSHQDEKLPENIGNDQADAIANAYRAEGEHVDPIPYFTLAEEKIIFQYHGNNIQGDVREVMKKIEQETMVEVWTKRTKVQSLWFQKHPTQILKQAKRVWQSAILKGEGSAWVYFIFAVCQWLPTNYSLYRKIQSDRSRISCVLCLSNRAETVDHLLVPWLQRRNICGTPQHEFFSNANFLLSQ